MSAADAEVAAAMTRIVEAMAKRIFKKKNPFYCIVYGRAEEQIWQGRIRETDISWECEGLTRAVERGRIMSCWVRRAREVTRRRETYLPRSQRKGEK